MEINKKLKNMNREQPVWEKNQTEIEIETITIKMLKPP